MARHIADVGPPGQRLRPLTPALQAGNDVHAVLSQGAAHGVPHVTGAEYGDGLERHLFPLLIPKWQACVSARARVTADRMWFLAFCRRGIGQTLERL